MISARFALHARTELALLTSVQLRGLHRPLACRQHRPVPSAAITDESVCCLRTKALHKRETTACAFMLRHKQLHCTLLYCKCQLSLRSTSIGGPPMALSNGMSAANRCIRQTGCSGELVVSLVLWQATHAYGFYTSTPPPSQGFPPAPAFNPSQVTRRGQRDRASCFWGDCHDTDASMHEGSA